MVKLPSISGILKPLKEFTWGGKIIEAKGGTKGGFDWIALIDKKTGLPLLYGINTIVKKQRKVEVGASGTTPAAIPIVNATVNYETYEERGTEPIIISNPRLDCESTQLSNLVEDKAVGSLLRDRMGAVPSQIYRTDPANNPTFGNYRLNAAENTIESHISAITDDQRQAIESLLTLLDKNFFAEGGYRFDVMFYNSTTRKLKIMADLNMLGYDDRSYEIDHNKGCGGTAFTSGYKTQVMVDLVEQGKDYGKSIGEPVQTYDDQKLADLGHKKYGVDPNTIWKEMRSLASVPILDKDGVTLGVLNIDCNKRLVASRLDTKEVKYNLRLICDAIGLMIGG
jgi:hypothetical protein